MASRTQQLKNHNHKTLKTLLKSYSNLTLSHLYSSSSSSSSDNNNNNNNNNGDNSLEKPNDFSSYVIKSRLRNAEKQQHQRQNPLKISDIEELRRNLSEIQKRSNVLAEDLYKKLNPNPNPNSNPNPNPNKSRLRQDEVEEHNKKFSGLEESLSERANPNPILKGSDIDGIRESIHQLREQDSKFVVNHMESPNARGRGKNRRRWTEEEDDALIEIMKELCNSGKYRADNSFRPGFPLAVEEALNAKLPGCGLKATPHINSRIRYFRSVFDIIHDMVVWKATTGFGWDSTKNCVIAPKDVWKDYLKRHPKAKGYKNKSCPYYEDLCIIFGKDRATGNDFKDFTEVVGEVNKEEANDPRDRITATESSSTQGGAQVESTNSTSGSQNKKTRVRDKWAEGIIDAALILGKEIKAASIELSCAVSYDLLLSEKQSKINEELLKLNGLTMMERHKVGRKIACDHETTDLFFSIMDEEKEEWVLSLLRGDT